VKSEKFADENEINKIDIHYYLLKKRFFSEKHVAIWLIFCNFAHSKVINYITLYTKEIIYGRQQED
jgi:hypothetical protein